MYAVEILSSSLITVSGLHKENEAVKLMTVKSGLMDLSQAWKSMGTKCSLIADSQKVRVTIFHLNS